VAGTGDGTAWWDVREDGAAARLQDAAASPVSQLHTAPPTSPLRLAERSEK